MKACVLDIEATSLEAIGAGVILCAVIQDYHSGKQTVLRIDDFKCAPGKEGPLVDAIVKHLSGYDLVIGHNVERYDLNFIKTRAMRLNVPCDIRPFVYDTMKAFRRCGILTVQNGFGKPSAGLAMAADALQLKQEKTSIYPGEWWQAVYGDKDQRDRLMRFIVEHCKADVRMTAALYRELLPKDSRANIRRML